MRISPIAAAVITSFACFTGAAAQPVQFGSGRPTSVQLSKPRVDVISGATATRFEQARGLAKKQGWDDAVDILRELAAERSNSLVEIGGGRYVSLRTACHLELARWPAEALAVYRRRVDGLAERWYRDGLANRDERLLRRVVDELFCNSWGDDALFALGELALERGDYSAARRNWEQISPLLRDPAGRSMWLSLHDVELAAHWPQVERRWHERPKSPIWLAYPDTQLNLADVRARLILASIRAGEFKRAALELEMFRHFYPQSSGRLGGQDGPYVAALERLLASAREWPTESPDLNWPTFGGSSQRVPKTAKLGPITGPAWRKPVSISQSVLPRVASRPLPMPPAFMQRGVEQVPNVDEPIRESQRPLSVFPVVVDGVVYFSEASQIRAVELATGEPAITGDGVLHRDQRRGDQSTSSEIQFGLGGWQTTYAVAHGVPRHSLSVIDGILYGRVGHPATWSNESRDAEARDRLVGLDLRRDGALAFRVRPPDGDWAFDGVPVGDGRRLFIAMRQSDVTPHAYVACFDVATGGQLWRTPIGAADTPAAGLGDEITHNLLTLAADRIYFNTNLGLVAALDAQSGDVCWLCRYERRAGEAFDAGRLRPLHVDRDPAPCLYHEGLVIVAPSDTPEIFALDADTGQTVWSTEKLPDALHLLGIVRHNLIVSGNRLAALDVRTGDIRFIWPDSAHAGIRGMGRGVVAGDEIFWPTRNEIYVIHGVTGAQSRSPIALGAISDCGANLAAANGRLIVAGHDKLMAFGPALPLPPNQNKPKIEPVAKAESVQLQTSQ